MSIAYVKKEEPYAYLYLIVGSRSNFNGRVMSADAMMERASQYFRDGDYTRAEALYAGVIDAQPTNFKAYSNRSAVYMKSGELQKALKDAQRCTQINPSFAKGWGRVGAALHALKHYEDAISAYSRAVSLEPSSDSYTAAIAELKALVADGRGVATDEGRDEYYFRRSVDQATSALKEGKYDDACRLYTKAMGLGTAAAEMHVLYANRSVAELKAGRSLQAVDDATASVVANPHYARGHVRLAIARLARNELDAARASANQAKILEPSSSAAAEVLRDIDKAELALAAAQKAQAEADDRRRAEIDAAREAASQVDVSAPASKAPVASTTIPVAPRHTVSYSHCRICSEYGHTAKDCPHRARNQPKH